MHSYPLSQAFEGGHSGGGGITRRTFIKRTGGATVGTMIAWNLTVNEARANEGDGSHSGSEIILYYLVCTDSPSPEQMNPNPSTDFRTVSIVPPIKRRKIDSYSADGPLKRSYILIESGTEAKFTISGLIATYLAVEDWAGNVSNNTLRTATETQDIVAVKVEKNYSIVYRAANAVMNTLKDENGQSGGLGNSAISGGIGIDKATVKAKTCWAGPGGSFAITISVASGALVFGSSGAPLADDMPWVGDDLEWAFQIMDQEALDAFMASS